MARTPRRSVRERPRSPASPAPPLDTLPRGRGLQRLAVARRVAQQLAGPEGLEADRARRRLPRQRQDLVDVPRRPRTGRPGTSPRRTAPTRSPRAARPGGGERCRGTGLARPSRASASWSKPPPGSTSRSPPLESETPWNTNRSAWSRPRRRRRAVDLRRRPARRGGRSCRSRTRRSRQAA